MRLIHLTGWVLAVTCGLMPTTVVSCTTSSGPPAGTDASFAGNDGTMFGDGEADSAVEAPEDTGPRGDDTSSPQDSGTLADADAAPEAEAAAPACNPAAPFGTRTRARMCASAAGSTASATTAG